MLTYTSAPLDHDLTVTGALAATLMASTSGTDADMGVYGRLEVRSASGHDPAAAAVGQRLVVVHDLFAGYLGKPIGARLSFETVDLSVADWEDELHWAVGQLPPAVGVRQR